jgi:hypothetical protein
VDDLFGRQKMYAARHGLRSVGVRVKPSVHGDLTMLRQELGVSLNDIIKCGILVYKQVLKNTGRDI